MKYKVTKMDGRYTTHGYRYLVEFSKATAVGTGVLDFDRSRRWFNQTFGWSQDVETRDQMLINKRRMAAMYNPEDFNPTWAYAVKYGDYRIYVDSDKTLSWFILSHPLDQ